MVEKSDGFRKLLSLKGFVVLVILLVFFFALISSFFSKLNREEIPTCKDGSFLATCSLDRPYFCNENGELLERSNLCGCSNGLEKSGNTCVSQHSTQEIVRKFKYNLRGETGEIKVPLYRGYVDYLSTLPNTIDYSNDELSFRVDFKLANINMQEQEHLLLPLIKEIQKTAETEEDQARIAINFVQNIEWGESDKTIQLGNSEVGYSRKVYETLYESQGLCGEKSDLLAFLLKELGYGVVLFYNQQENHESVGIKCPLKYSWHNSGYCFVETSGPAILSDSEIVYVGGITLDSKPQLLLISTGKSLSDDMYEYKDAKIMQRIRNGGILGVLYSPYKGKLEKKYGLAERYEIS